MIRHGVVLAWLIILVGVLITNSGCGGKPKNPGLLEQNGIKDAGGLAFVMVEMAEGGGSYRITDNPTLSRIYQLLNDAKHVSGISTYVRPDMVTLVRRNGRTLSFAFSLFNPALTWHYSSPAFVEFVKTEIAKSSKYLDQARLPGFTIGQAVEIESSTTRTILPSMKAQRVQQAISLLSSAYRPLGWTTKTGNWNTIAGYCTAGRPGFEVVLSKPVHFEALIGWTGPEPPNGSDALVLVGLTVDKMLICEGADQELSLAFHSGNSWFVTSGFSPKDLQGRTPTSVYSSLAGR